MRSARNMSIMRIALVLALVAFGALTLFLSGSVIFDLFGIRAKEGNYVNFVVWANFLASLLYLLSAFALFARRNWSATLLMAALVVLIVTSVGFAIHISGGGVHEQRTIGALAFRTGLTALFLFAAYRIRSQHEQPTPN